LRIRENLARIRRRQKEISSKNPKWIRVLEWGTGPAVTMCLLSIFFPMPYSFIINAIFGAYIIIFLVLLIGRAVVVEIGTWKRDK